MSADRLLGRLVGVRQRGRGRWLARCPAHEDRHPSLSIRELDDGRVLIKCWAGCEADAVLVAIGMSFGDVAPREPLAHRRKAELRPFPAADVLKAVAFEAQLVFICASDMAQGKILGREAMDRLRVAVSRIQTALEESGHA